MNIEKINEPDTTKPDKPEYTFDIVYRFMCRHKDFISSTLIMEHCDISKTQFYNALDQLRKLKLIEVKVDMGDFRKKYYRAIRKKNNIL